MLRLENDSITRYSVKILNYSTLSETSNSFPASAIRRKYESTFMTASPLSLAAEPFR